METKSEEESCLVSVVRFRETESISRSREEEKETKNIGRMSLMAVDELLRDACGRSGLLTSSRNQSRHGQQ